MSAPRLTRSANAPFRSRPAVPLLAAALAAAPLAGGARASAQGAAGPAPLPPARSLTERSDFSVYRDGRYVGHAYREARGRIAPIAPDPALRGAFLFEGRFFVLEETLRDLRSAARGVDRQALSRFSALPAAVPAATASFGEDGGFPSLRGLPSLPADLPATGPEEGAYWTAPGERSVELEGLAAPVVIPFLAEYRCLGREAYRGAPAIRLGAKFATRLGQGPRASEPGSALAAASGSHELEILVADDEGHAPLFIRDRFDETFALARGGSLRRSGFALLFFEGALPPDRGGTILALRGGGGEGAAPPAVPPAASPAAPAGAALPAIPAPEERGGAPIPAAAGEGASPPGAGPGSLLAGPGPGPLDEGAGPLAGAGVEIGQSPDGVVLRVRDLRFAADSDRILDSELWRLDAIASALAALPGRRILVEGHSASVGKSAGELELSGRRAARVAEALAARGVEAARIMYRGLGSGVPIASNATEEGRARNRRVEITILD